jgi:hypothetical protein
MTPVEASLPDWPYDSLSLKELKAQVPDAWPRALSPGRFLSAVDFVLAGRFRRSVPPREMARVSVPGRSVARPVAAERLTPLTNS